MFLGSFGVQVFDVGGEFKSCFLFRHYFYFALVGVLFIFIQTAVIVKAHSIGCLIFYDKQARNNNLLHDRV